MNNTFFIGIVESVEDPLKLNRVQVRVFGVHTEALDDIPTEKLPWALCLTNNAAVSGIGNSGTQYMRGSAVMVIFKDQESKQQPIILGGFHGVPIDISPFKGEEQVIDAELVINKVDYKQDIIEVDVNDEIGVPVDTSSTTGTAKPLPTKEEAKKESVATSSTDARTKLKARLAVLESGDNYTKTNSRGYVGKYQMGADNLVDRGYVKRGTKNNQLTDSNNWTGKDGINSAEDFKKNPAVQEKAMDASLDANEKQLKRMRVIDDNTTEQEKAGLLASSHLVGAGGAYAMRNGGKLPNGKTVATSDGNNTSGKHYYDEGYAAVAGKLPTVAPDKISKDNPSREPSPNPVVGKVKNPITRKDDVALGKIDVTAGGTKSIATSDLGFQDPEEEFPRYFDEQDTNRLARNQNIGETIVPIKEGLEHKNVQKANGKGMWNQSPTPYNARYPFNAVHETQSGHVIEVDDTPDNERLHLYHKTGTFEEIDANGTLVRRIVGDAYEVWDRDGYIHIKGTVNITVEGNANILVANDCELEIDGDLNANVGGNSNWSIGGNANYTVGKDVNWVVGGNLNHTVTKDDNNTIGGDLNFVVDGALNNDVGKDLNNTVAGNLNDTVSGDVNFGIGGDKNTEMGGSDTNYVAGNYMIITGGAEHHTNGATHAITAAPILVSVIPVIGFSAAVPAVAAMAGTASNSNATKLAPPPRTAEGATVFGKLELIPRGFEEINAFENEELTPVEMEDIQNDLESKGLIEPAPEYVPLDETKVEKLAETKLKGEPVMCDTFEHGKINPQDFISPNFRLADLLKGRALPLEYGGLLDVKIACNLKALAINVLEPIKSKYPNMSINSGWRPVIGAGAGSKSEHPKGMAADIRFNDSAKSLLEIAKDIAKTVPVGQLILEYTANSGWLHVSFGGSSTAPFTMYDHKRTGAMGQLLDKDTSRVTKKA